MSDNESDIVIVPGRTLINERVYVAGGERGETPFQERGGESEVSADSAKELACGGFDFYYFSRLHVFGHLDH